MQVTTCLNADIALHKIVEKEITPDLIILDLDMPMMDGFTFANTYAQVQTDHIPIIVLTNSIYKRDYEMAKTISLIKGYFLKPVNEDMIKEMLSYSLTENNK